MKKLIFGIILMICGTIGVLSLIFFAIILNQNLGSINGNSGFFIYLEWFGLIPIFFVFAFIGIVGIVISLIEVY